jgi:hypothetical protein
MILAAAPQVLDHPCCDFINQFPWGFFLAVHVALFAVGAFFALRSFDAGRSVFGWGFALFALAELVYLTYHINVTQFLFAHTIAEVLDALAFVTLFAAGVKNALVTWTPGATPAAEPARDVVSTR